jgi:DNA-binding MarR family transcriptional regulator
MKPDEAFALKRLEQALDSFCVIDASMPVSMAATLLRIARSGEELASGETNLRAMAAAAALPYSTFLRQIDWLGDGAPRVKGLRLLEKGFNAADRRARAVRLTPAGMRLLDELRGLFVVTDEDSEKIPEFSEIPEGNKNSGKSG